MDMPDARKCIMLRALAQGAGIGALAGAIAGAALVGVGPNMSAEVVAVGGLFGAAFGIAVGLACAIVAGLMLKVGARYFVGHVWMARIVAGVVCGVGMAAALVLVLAGDPDFTVFSPLTAGTFALGAAAGSYSAGFVIAGDACTVIRRLRVCRPV